MIKTRAITLGVVSGLTILCGSVVCIILYLLMRSAAEGSNPNKSGYGSDWENFESMSKEPKSPMWVVGFFFIIPGLLMLVASFVQNKCMYVTSSVMSLISLLIMGFVVIFAGVALVVLIIATPSISEVCRDSFDGCECRTDDEFDQDGYSVTVFKECHYFSTFATLCIILIIFVIASWVLMLAACIMAIYYLCSPPSQPGTVYTPVQQPLYPTPGYAYPQPPQHPVYLEAGGPSHHYEGMPSKV